MKLSDYIWDFLSSYVRHVFFVPGGGCMHLVDSLGQSKIKPINCMHEQAAGLAAVSYAQFNGLGVCLVTSGPGGTNAITACASAWCNSMPVLFISGQVNTYQLKTPEQRFNGVQELDIISMVSHITKGHYRYVGNSPVLFTRGKYMASGDWGIIGALRDLTNLAQQPRQGPVWLDIPLDVQKAEV